MASPEKGTGKKTCMVLKGLLDDLCVDPEEDQWPQCTFCVKRMLGQASM